MPRSLVFHRDLPGPAYVCGRYRIALAIAGAKSKRLWEVSHADDVIGHTTSLGEAKTLACAHEERLRSQAAGAGASSAAQ